MEKSFKEKIYSILRKVPKGKVVTYGQLARMAGNRKAARAVGAFMRLNQDAPHTPCHRVVASNGEMTGYSGLGGIKKKKKMLVAEGVHFKKERVDLDYSLWKS